MSDEVYRTTNFGIQWERGKLYEFLPSVEKQHQGRMLCPYDYNEEDFPKPWLKLAYLNQIVSPGSFVPKGLFVFIKSINWEVEFSNEITEFIYILYDGNAIVVESNDFNTTYASIARIE